VGRDARFERDKALEQALLCLIALDLFGDDERFVQFSGGHGCKIARTRRITNRRCDSHDCYADRNAISTRYTEARKIRRLVKILLRRNIRVRFAVERAPRQGRKPPEVVWTINVRRLATCTMF
jgi:hypothetical protein